MPPVKIKTAKVKRQYSGLNTEVITANILCNRINLINLIVNDLKLDVNKIILIDDQYHTGIKFKETGLELFKDKFKDINEIVEDKVENRYFFDDKIPIIYFINRIPEIAFMKMLQIFETCEKVIIIGDPMLNSPENNDYHMKFLSKFNHHYDLNVTRRFTRDVCSFINKVINKKYKIVSITSIISNYKDIKFFESDTISMTDPNNYDAKHLVVPKSLYTKLNSMHRRSQGINTVRIQDQEELFNDNEFKLTLKDGRSFRCPRGAIIKVLSKYDASTNSFPKIDKVKANIIFRETDSFEEMIIENVDLILNASYFALAFESDMPHFRESMPNVDRFLKSEDFLYEHAVAVRPLFVIESDMTKHLQADNITIYYQEKILDCDYCSKEPLYKYILSMKEKAVIYYSFNFSNIF